MSSLNILHMHTEKFWIPDKWVTWSWYSFPLYTFGVLGSVPIMNVWLCATGWISYHSDTIASHTADNNECWMLSGSIQSNNIHIQQWLVVKDFSQNFSDKTLHPNS